MKKIIKYLILTSLLSTTSAFAKSITCANLDYTAKADISEIYIDVLLLRRLFRVEINDAVVYRNFLGKIDNSESFEKNGYVFNMFSGGVSVDTGSEIYNMACSAPHYYNPGTLEHQKHVENWNYIFLEL